MKELTLVALGLTALSGCGPTLLVRGNGAWQRDAHVAAYPLSIVDESLDPPLSASDRSEFESSYEMSLQNGLSRDVFKRCGDARPCLHVRVSVRLRQDNTTERSATGTLNTLYRILAEAEVNLSDDGGRLIEVVQVQARSSGQLGFAIGQYIATQLRRAH
jgi:hypothetical protein